MIPAWAIFSWGTENMLVNTDSLHLQLSAPLGKRFSFDNIKYTGSLPFWKKWLYPYKLAHQIEKIYHVPTPLKKKNPGPASWSLSNSDFLPENYKTRHKPVSLWFAKMSEYLKICGCGVPNAFIQRTDSHSGNWGMPNSILVKDFTEL